MANDRTRERKTYPFFRQRPIFEAAVSALSGGPVPTGTGFRHVTAGTEDAAAKLVENADVAPAAAIDSTKLSFAGSTPITFAMPITASLGISASFGHFGEGGVAQTGDCLRLGPSIANAGVYNNLITARQAGGDMVFLRVHDGASYVNIGDANYINTFQGYSTAFNAQAGQIQTFNIGASPVVEVSNLGISGSLTHLVGGTSYLVAGAGVSIASQSNGQVLISAPAAESIRPTEFSFLSGLASTTLSTFSRIGARKIDLSSFPSTIGSLTRTVQFFADVDKTSGATTVEVQLYDSTHAVAVSGTDLTSISTASFEVTSSALTVGSSAGNVRSDVASQYELQLKMNGGGGSDAVFCTNARFVVTYV